MGAYVYSDAMPFVLHFENLDPADVRPHIETWIKKSLVMNLSALDIEGLNDQDVRDRVGETLVNFGALPCVRVRATEPAGDRMVVGVANTDLSVSDESEG